jgi:hypothetical protein
MPSPSKRAAYLVQQVAWEPDREVGDHFVRGPAEEGSAVKAFTDVARAEALRAELERDFRGQLNPFRYGRGLDDWTSWPEGVFRDWLLDAGLDPPAARAGASAWVAWWDAGQAALSELQRERVWEALDGVRFFAVLPLGPPGARGGRAG